MSNNNNNDLKNDLKNLDDELDDYSFNHEDVSEEDREKIKNFYTQWKKCINNKLIIEDVKKKNIRIDNNVLINNEIKYDSINRKNTLHFINCKNITIYIKTKVNHITLEHCKNVNIKTIGGSVSGLDNINCQNISHVFEKSMIYYINSSNSQHCWYTLSDYIADNILMVTSECFSINIRITNNNTGVVTGFYKTNMSIFNKPRIYCIVKEDNKLLLKYFEPPYNNIHIVIGRFKIF